MLLDSATAACPPRESHAMPARGMATVARGRVLLAVPWTALTLAALALLPQTAASQSSYLFVWAGGRGASEFIATICRSTPATTIRGVRIPGSSSPVRTGHAGTMGT
jgi:hypothetical protein